ncbi:hypothetical protein GCM10010862_18020 [Devosia nitrariae]|uniref:Uncharacterized protein n=1 Tax=Devosia nitrariae TaxID=2071872 RepID=A0ABQ5W3W8_9HYPH|nr:hypothetical protein GCM10010862_18020 [Devosia nitrariae]
MQAVGLGAQLVELSGGRGKIGRLVENLEAKRQGLVGTDHQGSRVTRSDGTRLGAGEEQSDIAGVGAGQVRPSFDGAFVHNRRLDGKIEAGADKQGLSRRTL